METELKNEVDAIVKFISKLYNPSDIEIKPVADPEGFVIIFYFNNISDRFIMNPNSRDISTHKENMLNREIRTYIQKYLGIKTGGLQPPEFFSPHENHPISVFVLKN